MSGAQELGERWIFPQWVEFEGVVEQGEAQVVGADGRFQQSERPRGQGSPFLVVGPIDGLRGQGERAGAVVAQVGIPRLVPHRGFQGLDCGGGSVAKLRGHDGRQVERGPIQSLPLISAQVGEGGFFLAEPCLHGRPEFERFRSSLLFARKALRSASALSILTQPRPPPCAPSARRDRRAWP